MCGARASNDEKASPFVYRSDVGIMPRRWFPSVQNMAADTIARDSIVILRSMFTNRWQGLPLSRSLPLHLRHLSSRFVFTIMAAPRWLKRMFKKNKNRHYKRAQAFAPQPRPQQTPQQLFESLIARKQFTAAERLMGVWVTTETLFALVPTNPPVSLLVQVLSCAPPHAVWEDATNGAGQTALHLAAASNVAPPIVQRLLSGVTACMPACTKDSVGRHALHYACTVRCDTQQVVVIDLILQAYPQAVLIADDEGHTPLDLAVGNDDVVQLLELHANELREDQGLLKHEAEDDDEEDDDDYYDDTGSLPSQLNWDNSDDAVSVNSGVSLWSKASVASSSASPTRNSRKSRNTPLDTSPRSLSQMAYNNNSLPKLYGVHEESGSSEEEEETEEQTRNSASGNYGSGSGTRNSNASTTRVSHLTSLAKNESYLAATYPTGSPAKNTTSYSGGRKTISRNYNHTQKLVYEDSDSSEDETSTPPSRIGASRRPTARSETKWTYPGGDYDPQDLAVVPLVEQHAARLTRTSEPVWCPRYDRVVSTTRHTQAYAKAKHSLLRSNTSDDQPDVQPMVPLRPSKRDTVPIQSPTVASKSPPSSPPRNKSMSPRVSSRKELSPSRLSRKEMSPVASRLSRQDLPPVPCVSRQSPSPRMSSFSPAAASPVRLIPPSPHQSAQASPAASSPIRLVPPQSTSRPLPPPPSHSPGPLRRHVFRVHDDDEDGNDVFCWASNFSFLL